MSRRGSLRLACRKSRANVVFDYVVSLEVKTMSANFAEIVEDVKTLSVKEKEELHCLIEKYLIEERRDEILDNFTDSINELAEEKLDFTNDIDALKRML
jgi:phosphopantothenate synthetase